jgi:hypothetical protein
MASAQKSSHFRGPARGPALWAGIAVSLLLGCTRTDSDRLASPESPEPIFIAQPCEALRAASADSAPTEILIEIAMCSHTSSRL